MESALLHLGFEVLSLIAICFLLLMLVLALFEPGLPYKVIAQRSAAPDSARFQRVLAALAGSHIHDKTRVEVLSAGQAFYEAMLEEIRSARQTINLEAYIFKRGDVARRFVAALLERARAGVRVNMNLDAIGSFTTWAGFFKELREAGGRVHYYHPLRWYTLPRFNNRTHREILVVDGRVGFVGGAGYADYWLEPHGRGRRKKPWRDTMFKVQGGAVTGLQSTFVENWVETTGEVLSGEEYFPLASAPGSTQAMVVTSSPTTGRSTRGRLLYQTLLASARKSIHITTPYFLPDKTARAEMVRAMRERGVEIKVVTPGQHTDHLITRRSSRRLFGDLLRAGAWIGEYQPTMIHAKVMIVDGAVSVVGSTNFDHRSFGLNDEVNLVTFDPALADRLEEDFVQDQAQCRAVSYKEWMGRSRVERLTEWFGWLLERQQ
jgi:cardiolipin synthase A/B